MAFRVVVFGDFATSQSHGFHLQVDVGVDVGRIKGNMPEPGANGVYINASAEQVRSGRMSHGVGANALCRERRHLDPELNGVASYKSINPKARHRMSAPIEKDIFSG